MLLGPAIYNGIESCFYRWQLGSPTADEDLLARVGAVRPAHDWGIGAEEAHLHASAGCGPARLQWVVVAVLGRVRAHWRFEVRVLREHRRVGGGGHGAD